MASNTTSFLDMVVNKLRGMTGAVLKRKQKDSLDWFFKEIKKSSSSFSKNAFNPVTDPFIGGLFQYIYDPKLKDKLPYWDRFPCVVPIGIYPDGFLGINLHYLRPISRAQMFEFMLRAKKLARGNKGAYMDITYQTLKGSKVDTLMRRSIKRYLSNHIRSQIIKVEETDWEKIVYLPTQQFQKSTAENVWKKESAEAAARRARKGKN